MRKLSLLLIVLFCFNFLPNRAAAQPKNPLGFGVVLGQPIGGTVKYWNSQTSALNFYLSGDSYWGSVRMGVDYDIHFKYDLIPDTFFWFYLAPGGTVAIGDNFFALGGRGLIGANLMLTSAPFEFYLELGPALWILPDVNLGFDGGIGVRFYPGAF